MKLHLIPKEIRKKKVNEFVSVCIIPRINESYSLKKIIYRYNTTSFVALRKEKKKQNLEVGKKEISVSKVKV